MRQLMRFFQNTPPGFDDYVDSFLLLNPSYGCTQAGMFRYLVVFLEGGLYFDCKSGCNHPERFKQFAPLGPIVLTHWGHATHPELILCGPKQERRKVQLGFCQR